MPRSVDGQCTAGRSTAHQTPPRCSLTPIPAGSPARHSGLMTKFAIRLHPSVPVSIDELEQWLDHQVMDLRATAPEATVRLSRVTQPFPSGDVDVGWLIEFELCETQQRLVLDRV